MRNTLVRVKPISVTTVLNVSDFEASAHFYEAILGFVCVFRWDEEEGPGMILQGSAGRNVELVGPPHAARSDKRIAAGMELAFYVDDVHGEHDRVAAQWPVARGLTYNPWGDRSFGIDDPDGVRIWIAQVTDGSLRSLL